MSETIINLKVPELRTIITISVNGDNQLVVHAPMSNKKLCMHALADALKVVADHEEATTEFVTEPPLSGVSNVN